MRVIVTGGAGYIGGHVVLAAGHAGHEVTVVDNLFSGDADTVRQAALVKEDVSLPGRLLEIARSAGAQAILHLAGRIEVGESVAQPGIYYDTNVGGMIRVCEAARVLGCPVVFSSTAAVYGEPHTLPIPVDHPCRPQSPYGHSKWMSEQILADCARAGDFRYISLRFFNAAGAVVGTGLGERHNPESHLVPRAIDAARQGSTPLSIFGTDWPTQDGTCVRDYVHVGDLADAHVLALDHLVGNGASAVLNLGAGFGTTVREVLASVERAVGRAVPVVPAARRPGDVASLVADISAARALLGWEPRRSDIDTIVRDAVAAR